MIVLDQIKNQYPLHLQGFSRFIIKEYLQYKILEIIFESSFATHFCFLGGTNLRLVHNNQRFSEDLDFDNFNFTPAIFDAVANLIQEKLLKQGYNIELKTFKKGAFHCYIKFPEVLYQQGLSPVRQEKILIQLDTENQAYNYVPEQFILNKFDVFVPIQTCSLDLLLAQKMYAVLNRKRNKGRDFFDIVFILSKSNKIDYRYLQQKVNIKNEKQLKEKILEKCATLDMQVMAKDVAPFLFNSNDEKKILLFTDYIKQAKFIQS
jgi:predicted nucleotidyltransferase component of viral defense system